MGLFCRSLLHMHDGEHRADFTTVPSHLYKQVRPCCAPVTLGTTAPSGTMLGLCVHLMVAKKGSHPHSYTGPAAFYSRPCRAPLTVGPTALRMSCLRGSGRFARPQKKHSDVRRRRDSSGVPAERHALVAQCFECNTGRAPGGMRQCGMSGAG